MSDPYAVCEFVSRNGDCVTFRCEAGSTREHLVKTNQPKDVDTLMNMIEKK